MDPMTNPTPNPNPVPNPESTPGPVPTPTPAPAPEPVQAPQPVAAPVNPIVQPTAPVVNPTPANPVIQPTGLAATDPIMRPEPAPAPDPIAEELQAPMKAADPVPGSIGSAVSGPAIETDKQTPSVAFNDPATQADTPATDASGKPVKKSSRTTLIALIIVAVMIIIGLVGVLVFQFMSGDNSGSKPAAGGNTPAVSTPEPESEPEEEPEETSNTVLKCTHEEDGASAVATLNFNTKLELDVKYDMIEVLDSASVSVTYTDGEEESEEMTAAEFMASLEVEDTNFTLDELKAKIINKSAEVNDVDVVCEVL